MLFPRNGVHGKYTWGRWLLCTRAPRMCGGNSHCCAGRTGTRKMAGTFLNETVPGSLRELKGIYGAFGAKSEVQLIVSKGKKHEMDNEALFDFLETIGMGEQDAAADAKKPRR